MTTISKQIGDKGEEIARQYLKKQGFQILTQNYYSKYGEIDIIAEKNNSLHFFEVKTRRPYSINHPLESITYQKSQRIIKTALNYLSQNNENRVWTISLISILLQRHLSPEIEIYPLH